MERGLSQDNRLATSTPHWQTKIGTTYCRVGGEVVTHPCGAVCTREAIARDPRAAPRTPARLACVCDWAAGALPPWPRYRLAMAARTRPPSAGSPSRTLPCRRTRRFCHLLSRTVSGAPLGCRAHASVQRGWLVGGGWRACVPPAARRSQGTAACHTAARLATDVLCCRATPTPSKSRSLSTPGL